MTTSTKTYQIKNSIDLSLHLNKGDQIITSTIDHGFINVLIIHGTPQYRTENGSFSMVKSDTLKDFTFLRLDLDGNIEMNTRIEREFFNFHHACYLPSNEILLVCGRCRYKSETEFDKNARVYSVDGKLKHDFVVGDGVQDVRVSSTGEIWISYFDEGIFGNYGWQQPIGFPGLISWDNHGNKTWEFQPVEGLNYMADCYAMNIDLKGNIWFCYYTEFPIVKLDKEKNIRFWHNEVAGSDSINVLGDRILMGEGYDNDGFRLFTIQGRKLKLLQKIKFESDLGENLGRRHCVSSDGPLIGFYHENRFSWIHMNEFY